MEFAIGHGGDRDRRKAGGRICLRRRAGKLALRKSRAEALIRGDRRIDGAIRHARRNGRASHRAKKAALKRLHVWRIDADQVRNAARQNIAEDSEARPQHGVRFELPRDRGARLQDGERRGRK